jgi:hypothetical protein
MEDQVKQVYIDGLLVDLGEQLFFGGKRPKHEQKGASSSPLRKVTAKAVRGKLQTIARRSPEVIVKISGGGKGMKRIKDHLDYISRNGKLEVEDQDGNMINGRDQLRDLRDEWQYGGAPIPDESNVRDAFNIVLSMPAGTDERAVKRAARDFAAREFTKHQYVMVLHTFDTDPDRQPSPHPHVHLSVKARADDGRRLNPRKADIQRWREGYAEALREHGVEAAATRRQQRLKRERGQKQSVYQMKQRGQKLDRVGASSLDQGRIAKAKQTEVRMLHRYREITKLLASSDSPEDRKLAAGVIHRLDADQRHQGQQEQAEPAPSRRGEDR